MGPAIHDDRNPHDHHPLMDRSSSLMAETKPQDVSTDKQSEKGSDRTYEAPLSTTCPTSSAFGRLLGRTECFTDNAVSPSFKDTPHSIRDLALIPTTGNSLASLVFPQHASDISSWRGELVVPCMEEQGTPNYDVDIFTYTNKIFRGREIRFPVATFPANEQGWESLRQDLIERARRHGYNLTSRGRDIERSRIRLVCQQYRLYRKSGSFQSNHGVTISNKEDERDLQSETSSALGVNADIVSNAMDESPLAREPSNKSKRPKTSETKCRVQLCIFYKHWGDPRGYFFLKGGTGESVHSHHTRLGPPDCNVSTQELVLAQVAKLPPSGNRVADDLQPHFSMVSSSVLQFPEMLYFAKQSLIELSMHIKNRGLESMKVTEGSEQEVLSSCAALSAMKESGTKRRKT